MKKLAAAVTLLSFGCAPVEEPTSGDARAVIRAVMANRDEGLIVGPCVRLDIRSIAFDRTRHAGAWPVGQEPAPEDREPQPRPWLSPSSGVESAGAIDRNLAAELFAAERNILRRDPDPILLASIEPTDIPEPLRPFTSEEECGSWASFSSPTFDREFAFVEGGFTCGAWCGTGMIYALRRDGSTWTIIARSVTWIS